MTVKVTMNLDAVLVSLEEAKKTITRKLEGMVAEFSVDMARVASENTPIGDYQSMQRPIDGGNRKYRAYYESRMDGLGIPIEPGYHKGAWEYGMPSFKPVINDVQGMLNDIGNEAESKYKLGDLVVIGAVGPGYEMLYPDIKAPTEEMIVNVYKADIQRYYDAAV